MNITQTAQSKIAELTDADKAFRLRVTGDFIDGSHLDLILNSEVLPSDVTMCFEPLVIADMHSVNFLSGREVDYDTTNKEFVITDQGSK